MKLAKALLLIITAGLMVFSPEEVHAEDELTVGTRIAPPFVIEEDDGSLSGITIELWGHISSEMGISYDFEILDIEGMLQGVEDDRLYASASALTITSEREERVDFTHPFFISGFGIAVGYTPQGVWQAFMAIFSYEFIFAVGLLLLLLLFLGLLVWIFERKTNTEEFGGTTAEGLGSGFWWAAVTMTTVGYGDKSPRTFGGRVVGFIWMFAAIIVISFFTASIASSLTVTQLDSKVSGPSDLPHVRVGVLENSFTEDYMQEQRIRYTTFSSIDNGMDAVEDGTIDAFVHDAPIIQYIADQNYKNRVQVLPNTFNNQYYGIALPRDVTYRNQMNTILLDFISSDEWETILDRYGIR